MIRWYTYPYLPYRVASTINLLICISIRNWPAPLMKQVTTSHFLSIVFTNWLKLFSSFWLLYFSIFCIKGDLTGWVWWSRLVTSTSSITWYEQLGNLFYGIRKILLKNFIVGRRIGPSQEWCRVIYMRNDATE